MLKHSLLFILFFLKFSILIFGQSLTVKSYKNLPNDMAARLNYPKKDQDGNVCAIIKVVTSEKGFKFENGSLGIIATEQKSGEVWVYVPKGTKKITITHDNLGILREYLLEEPTEEAKVYELQLVSGKMVTRIQEENYNGFLSISSNPDGADIWIDDKPIGKQTPLKNHSIIEGSHKIQIMKPLYYDYVQQVVIQRDENNKFKDIVLKKNHGSLQINTLPESEAKVFLNNIEQGLTPLNKEKIKSGTYDLKITLHQYEDLQQSIIIRDGETLNLDKTLQANFGNLAVESVPAGASINIDGLDVSEKTPYMLKKLSLGNHSISLSLDLYETIQQNFELKKGQEENKTIKVKFLPLFGTLTIHTQPQDAEIWIDAKKEHIGNGTYKLSEGAHFVEIKHPKYYNEQKNIAINNGKLETISFTLQPKVGELTIISTPDEAEIYIDGNKELKTTPRTIRNIRIGTHQIIIQKEGYIKQTFEAEVKENNTTNISTDLTSIASQKIIDDDIAAVARQRQEQIAEEARKVKAAERQRQEDLKEANIGGRTYQIVKIGTQTWMAENLNETRHANGASSCYDNIASNCEKYGRLYDWAAANDIDSKIDGWHLPSDDEWTTLSTYLGGEDIAGEKMKVGGSSGFNALYAGKKHSYGYSLDMGSIADFWSATAFRSGYAWSRSIYRSDASLSRDYDASSDLRFSVRMLKD